MRSPTSNRGSVVTILSRIIALSIAAPIAVGAGTQIGAAAFHSCALVDAGAAKCWGSNVRGRLGDGSTQNRLTPTAVSTLESGVTTVAAGSFHGCAITAGGGLKCWGWNPYGQLGDGTTTDKLTPVGVTGPWSSVARISAGSFHTCARSGTGALFCWGLNGDGNLGDGSTVNKSSPVPVSGLSSGVAEVSAGYRHTCAVTILGGVKCWGSNATGQLGDGTTALYRPTPVDVVGLSSGVKSVSAGSYHTCARTAVGGVLCWGTNANGQLGNGTLTGSNTPVAVIGLEEAVVDVSAGDSHTCALTVSGTVMCWGGNSRGQLGDGTDNDSATPVSWALPPPPPPPMPKCGNGVAELGEDCDGGECCATDCRLRGSSEPCAGSTPICQEPHRCTGTRPDCPDVPTFQAQGAPCFPEDVGCTIGACDGQGTCEPRGQVCDTNATPKRNGSRRLRIKVTCQSDKESECAADASDTASAAALVISGATSDSTETITEMGTAVTKRRRTNRGAFKFKSVLRLKLNERGLQLLAERDVDALVNIRIRRDGQDFTAQRPVHLLAFRK